MQNFFNTKITERLLIASFVFSSSFSYSKISRWELRKNNFREHTQLSYKRQTYKAENKKRRIQNAEKMKSQQQRLKREFLNNRSHTDKRENSRKFFQTFLTPSVSRKQSLKKKYIENIKKEKRLKNLYKIPMEQQIFL